MVTLAENWGWILLLAYVAGWASAFHVLHTDRSPQATVGWTLALIFMAPLAVPFYWTVGARRYRGYRRALQRAMATHHEAIDEIFRLMREHAVTERPAFAALQKLTPFPLTNQNSVELLIDGDQTFDALFAAVEAAQDYILAEYFTIEHDALGLRFLDILRAKAKQGVRVYVLYDLVGSHGIHRREVDKLQQAGIRMQRFHSPRFPASYLHINFRNHRKICVVDGHTGFLGGLNIGDLYLGKNPRLCPWRDTHLRLKGPSVPMLQAVFLADWYWATHAQIELRWDHPVEADATGEVAILPTGPADRRSFCTLMILELIHQAKDRIWITTPYLVPTEAIIMALESAANRGVDVRILAPDCPDSRITFYASWYFAHRLREVGVRIFRGPGFIHQKVVLVDKILSTVGTANLDPRSLELNFEVTAVMTDPESIAAVEAVLVEDFEKANPTAQEWPQLRWRQRTAARVCRLFSPLL